MIVHNRDGSIVCTGGDGASEIIAGGMTAADRDTAIAAFFAAHPTSAPATVAMWKAKAALAAAGLLAQVDAAVAAQPQAVQLAWEYATELHRDSSTLAAMAATIGLSAAQIDELFRQASAVAA
jgi:hypothetical protein